MSSQYYPQRQDIEKVLSAINRLQKQSAAIYAELMSMSGTISDALKSDDGPLLVASALKKVPAAGEGGKEEIELDIF
jgi:hypothetical protein